ncbi:hypothetical protein [Kineococcus rhizosphaerae]|uniref:Transcriptional regulator with AbiEi antitoxin domain of type IV toxin-antitoxin system n=1 Tax=Kineococcus rhizosphaerae TaxID=559628 RepID=A0A2T0R9P7_9ACTN|nr:hypothetical protein [Kineococcus rhizosphaerae]PRY17851.1 hypothetical protein CLV37_10189 [Kineococcus rhizosphaerae]
MPTAALVPDPLRNRPFTLAEALERGLTPRRLQSSVWRRLHTGVYVHRDAVLDDRDRVEALRLASPPGTAFSGLTAAWIHGLWTPPPGVRVPLQTTRSVNSSGLEGADGRSRRQILRLQDDDLVEVDGLEVTSLWRTAFDLVRDAPLVDGVSVLDTFAGQGLDLPEFLEHLSRHRRWPGVAVAWTATALCDGRSRSVGESRLRMTAVLAGLPEPWVNPSLVVPTATGPVLRFPDLLVRGRHRTCGLEFVPRKREVPQAATTARTRSRTRTSCGRTSSSSAPVCPSCATAGRPCGRCSA